MTTDGFYFSTKYPVITGIDKEKKMIVLHRQGSQRQRLESPTVAPPGVQVNTRYLNSSKGTSSKKDASLWHIYPPFQARSATQVCTGIQQNQFLFESGQHFFRGCAFGGVHLVYTQIPGGVTIGDSGLCCCVPCPSSTIISLCLLILHKCFRPHSITGIILKCFHT